MGFLVLDVMDHIANLTCYKKKHRILPAIQIAQLIVFGH